MQKKNLLFSLLHPTRQVFEEGYKGSRLRSQATENNRRG